MKNNWALILDLDDTLYDRAIPFRNALRDVLDVEIPDYPREMFLIYDKYSQEVFWAHERGELTLEESRILRISKAMAECKIPFDKEKAAKFQERYIYYQYHLELSETMVNFLDKAKELGLTLGILTNGPTQHQTNKVRSLELDRWVDWEHVLISEMIGITKPDVRIFRYMEEKLGLDPKKTIMIGDSYKTDIRGALNAGWHSIWLNVGGAALPGVESPDRMIRSEQELWELLSEFECTGELN